MLALASLGPLCPGGLDLSTGSCGFPPAGEGKEHEEGERKNASVKTEATNKIEDGNSGVIPEAAEKGRL